MELSAVGERVFAAESIIKRRIRRVSAHPSLLVGALALLQRRLVMFMHAQVTCSTRLVSLAALAC